MASHISDGDSTGMTMGAMFVRSNKINRFGDHIRDIDREMSREATPIR